MERLELLHEYVACKLVLYGCGGSADDVDGTPGLLGALYLYQDAMHVDPLQARDRINNLEIVFEDYVTGRWSEEKGHGGAHTVWDKIDGGLSGHAEALHKQFASEYEIGDVRAILHNAAGDGSCFFQALAHALIRANTDAAPKHSTILQLKLWALDGVEEVYRDRSKSAYQSKRWLALKYTIENDLPLLPQSARRAYKIEFTSFLNALKRDPRHMRRSREVYAFEIAGIAVFMGITIHHYIVTRNDRFESRWQEYNRDTRIKDFVAYLNPDDITDRYKWQKDTYGDDALDERGEKIHEQAVIPSFKEEGAQFEVQHQGSFPGEMRSSLSGPSVCLVSVGLGVPVSNVGSLKYTVGTCHWGMLEFGPNDQPITSHEKPFTIERSKGDLPLLTARTPTPTI